MEVVLLVLGVLVVPTQKTLKWLVFGPLRSYRHEKKTYKTNLGVPDPIFGVPEPYDCNLRPKLAKNCLS